MQNNQSSRYDCLTKDFYDTFWNHVKKTQINLIREAKLRNQLSFAHRQAIIRLTEEKVKDNTFRFIYLDLFRPAGIKIYLACLFTIQLYGVF